MKHKNNNSKHKIETETNKNDSHPFLRNEISIVQHRKLQHAKGASTHTDMLSNLGLGEDQSPFRTLGSTLEVLDLLKIVSLKLIILILYFAPDLFFCSHKITV